MRTRRLRLPLLVLLLVVLLGAAPAGASPLVVATRLAVARYADPAVAQEAGYQAASVSNGVEHWLNPAWSHDGGVLDGGVLDPERPQGLVYLETGHGLRLVAALFMLDHAGQEPPPVPGATWHHHTWCQGAGGIGFPLPGGPCPPGTSLQVGPDMLHVWMADVPINAFTTDMTPRLVCLLAGRSANQGGF